MKASFDTYASSYDQEFTHSAIGKLQRERVWDLMEKDGGLQRPLKVLEVNCGTGEDAYRFASLGHQIWATDISEQMIEVAKNKANALNAKNINFQVLGFNDILSLKSNGPFDLIFSNFGGLNCARPQEFEAFVKSVQALLVPGGSFIAVIMPRFCWWETLFYLLKNPRLAFRRSKVKATAQLGTGTFDVYYYTPLSLVKGIGFQMVRVSPVGFFLPPSYLERFFVKRSKILGFLNWLEKKLPDFQWLAAGSDHFYIHLKRI